MLIVPLFVMLCERVCGGGGVGRLQWKLLLTFFKRLLLILLDRACDRLTPRLYKHNTRNQKELGEISSRIRGSIFLYPSQRDLLSLDFVIAMSFFVFISLGYLCIVSIDGSVFMRNCTGIYFLPLAKKNYNLTKIC